MFLDVLDGYATPKEYLDVSIPQGNYFVFRRCKVVVDVLKELLVSIPQGNYFVFRPHVFYGLTTTALQMQYARVR